MKISELSKINSSLLSKHDSYDRYIYLDTANLTRGVVKALQEFTSFSDLPSRARRKVSQNSILYSTVRPNQEHFGILENPSASMVVSTGFCVIDVDRDIADPKYIYYFLSRKSIVNKLQAIAEQATTAYPSIRASDIGNIEIYLPELKKQQEIGRALSDIDKKISINSQINDNLRKQAQAIFSNQIVECYQSTNRNYVPLGDLVTISTKSINPCKIPETMLEHYSIPAFDENQYPAFESSKKIKSNKYIVDSSCLLISKLNPTTKRVWRPYCLTQNSVCSTEFIVYKANDGGITDFIYSVIDSDPFSRFMCSHATGSTGSRQRTNPSDTLNYEVVFPSRAEILKFQHLVSPMYAQIRENQIENEKLKRLRDLLLSASFQRLT